MIKQSIVERIFCFCSWVLLRDVKVNDNTVPMLNAIIVLEYAELENIEEDNDTATLANLVEKWS